MNFKSLPFSPRLLGLAAGFLGLTLLSNQLFYRIDMTDDKIYTLSEGSLKIVQKLEEEVTAKIYVSKSFKDLPPAFKAHGRRVEEVLREYAHHAGGRLKIEVIDPQPDTDDEVWARKYGVRGFPSPRGESAYLGIVFIAGDKEHALPFLDPRKEDLLEFEISEGLIKLQRGGLVKLGIYSANYIGTTDSQAVDEQGNRTERAFLSRMKEFYQVEVFQNPPAEISSDFKVFMVYQPKDVDEKFQYALDQYVLRGGRLIVVLDALSRAEVSLTSNMDAPPAPLPQAPDQLPTLLKHWGLRFHHDSIIGDPLRSTRVNMVSYAFDYPFFLTLGEEDFSRDHMITASLKQMQWAESGWFEALPGSSSLRFESLVRSSPQAGTAPIGVDGLRDHQNLIQQLSEQRGTKDLAVTLQGRFVSAYPGPPEGSESQAPHLSAGEGENTVLLVADSDFMQEAQALEAFEYGGQMAQRPRNDNISFIINALAFQGGATELATIRSSGRVQRPFTRVRDLQEKAKEKWKAEEDRFAEELRSLQTRLSELKKVPAEGEEIVLTPEEEAELRKYREEELKVRGKLREVRRSLREDIEALGHRLLALNLLFVPGCVSGLGFLVFWRRGRRTR